MEIDNACRRILEAKYKLGLFEDPYRYCDENRAKTEVFTPENRLEARRMATESFVLLKNNNNTLPLKKEGSIALIGPLADSKENMPGTWSVAANASKAISVLAGLKDLLGAKAKIVYAKGSNLTEDSLLEQRATMFGKSLKRNNQTEKEMLDEALAIANQSDVIVIAAGEAAEMSGESSSRTDLEIPAIQRRMIQAMLNTGKPVVLVLFTGRPLVLIWEDKNVPAILNVWFGGSEAGHAVADVLFGDVNPSGKLTTTFPQNVGQIPLYYAHKNTGRPLPKGKWFEKFRSNYLDVSNDPLYPFGFGLSYTSFSYDSIVLNKYSFKPGEKITASIGVSNTGNVKGKEVVQLYIRDIVGSVTRPVKELKAFQKIELNAGETKTVSFEITENDLKFYNYDLKFLAEPGNFKLFIGGNSRDVKEATFNLLK